MGLNPKKTHCVTVSGRGEGSRYLPVPTKVHDPLGDLPLSDPDLDNWIALLLPDVAAHGPDHCFRYLGYEFQADLDPTKMIATITGRVCDFSMKLIQTRLDLVKPIRLEDSHGVSRTSSELYQHLLHRNLQIVFVSEHHSQSETRHFAFEDHTISTASFSRCCWSKHVSDPPVTWKDLFSFVLVVRLFKFFELRQIRFGLWFPVRPWFFVMWGSSCNMLM